MYLQGDLGTWWDTLIKSFYFFDNKCVDYKYIIGSFSLFIEKISHSLTSVSLFHQVSLASLCSLHLQTLFICLMGFQSISVAFCGEIFNSNDTSFISTGAIWAILRHTLISWTIEMEKKPFHCRSSLAVWLAVAGRRFMEAFDWYITIWVVRLRVYCPLKAFSSQPSVLFVYAFMRSSLSSAILSRFSLHNSFIDWK